MLCTVKPGNKSYIEIIHQMSYSSLSNNGMLQIFSFLIFMAIYLFSQILRGVTQGIDLDHLNSFSKYLTQIQMFSPRIQFPIYPEGKIFGNYLSD